MIPSQQPRDKTLQSQKDSGGIVEKIANAIDPAGTEVSDEEIKDPGTYTRDFQEQKNTSNDNPPKPR